MSLNSHPTEFETNSFWKPETDAMPDFWEGCFLLMNKPYGPSSFKIVHEIRKAITRNQHRKLKIGHAGTLDPLASGLLIIATGKLTRLLDQFQALDKEYRGRFRLGYTRPSYDMESGIQQYIHIPRIAEPSSLEFAKNKLTGEIFIKPPAHSAIKTNGKRAYQMARSGAEVKLDTKPMNIQEFDLDVSHYPEIAFKIRCSKGTYIRSLAHEFGQITGYGAYLSALERSAIGPYSVQQAWKFDQLLKVLKHGNTRYMD